MEGIGNIEALFHQERDPESEFLARWTGFLESHGCSNERMQDDREGAAVVVSLGD